MGSTRVELTLGLIKHWQVIRSDLVSICEGIGISVDSIPFANEYYTILRPLIFWCDDDEAGCDPSLI